MKLNRYEQQQDCRLRTLGKITIKKQQNELNNQTIKSYFKSEQWSNLLKSNIWNIKDGDWQTIKCKDCFKDIQIIHIKEIKLCNNMDFLIINTLIPISFPNLIEIDLSGNRICSIQNLYQIQAFGLKKLKLSNNCITSIKSLQKLKTPKISWIDFTKNYIIQPSQLIGLQAPIIKMIWFQSYGQKCYSNNRKWIFKLSSKRIQDLWLEHSKKLDSYEIAEMISNKFVNLHHTCNRMINQNQL